MMLLPAFPALACFSGTVGGCTADILSTVHLSLLLGLRGSLRLEPLDVRPEACGPGRRLVNPRREHRIVVLPLALPRLGLGDLCVAVGLIGGLALGLALEPAAAVRMPFAEAVWRESLVPSRSSTVTERSPPAPALASSDAALDAFSSDRPLSLTAG